MKTCTGCKRAKLFCEFYKNSKGKFGLQDKCKVCCKTYRDATKADRVQYDKKRYAANIETVLLRNKLNRQNNLETRRQNDRNYYAVNRERLVAEAAMRRSIRIPKPRTNEDRARDVVRSAKRRAQLRNLPAESFTKQEIIDRDGWSCWLCGCSLEEGDKHQVDHLIPVTANLDKLKEVGIDFNPGTVLANLAFTCKSCGPRKHGRIMLCAVMRYLKNCKEATPVEIAMVRCGCAEATGTIRSIPTASGRFAGRDTLGH